MLYDSLSIGNFPQGGENRFGETTRIVGETLMGYAGKVASRLTDAVGELRGMKTKNMNNVLFASWLMFAPVIAPISAKASNINNNANTSSVGLQQGDACEVAIATAIGEQCGGAVNGSFVEECELPGYTRLHIGTVKATRDPYKEAGTEPMLPYGNITGEGFITGTCDNQIGLAQQIRQRVADAHGRSEAQQVEAVGTTTPGGTPDVPAPQPTIEWTQTCTVDGVQTLPADYVFPERQYYPTTEDPNFDPARVGIDYFVIDTRTTSDAQRTEAVFTQLNELLRVIIPWGVQITDSRAIELLNDPRFPGIFMGNKEVVITQSQIIDIADFLNCVAPDWVLEGNPPIMGPTATPLSAPERFNNSVGDSMGNFGNWLRGIGAWLRNLGSWIGGGQGSSENSGPMITSTEHRSSESKNIASNIVEDTDLEKVALQKFYKERINEAPNRQAREIWARRALRAGC